MFDPAYFPTEVVTAATVTVLLGFVLGWAFGVISSIFFGGR